ncbi:MAG: polysaccharide deacetylase family protein [Bacteroidales bacterium]
MLYLTRNPKFVKLLYPDMIWNIRVNEKVIFLTFDDGSDPMGNSGCPQFTCKILRQELLFFVWVKKLRSILKLFSKFLKGHIIGNHSHKHLNGRKTASEIYISDILNAAEVLNTRLFRPPYGRITSKTSKSNKIDFKIIMWTVLPTLINLSPANRIEPVY